MADTLPCPFCGKPTPSESKNCSHCGGPLHGGMMKSGLQRPCPNCGVAVQPGDIICTACGTSLLTGQKLAVEKAPPKPSRNYTPLLRQAAVFFVLLVLLAGAVAGVLYLMRDPVEGARRMAQQGNMLEAMKTLQSHVQRHRNDREAQLLLGKLQVQNQQPAKAVDSFAAAYRLKPDEAAPAYFAVVAADKLPGEEGRKRQVAVLGELLKKHPQEKEAWRLLALALASAKDYQGLSEVLGNAAAAGETSRQATNEVAGYSKGLDKDLAGAEEIIRKQLEEQPENAEAAAALGFVLNMQGQTDAAIEWLQKGIELKSTVTGLAELQLGLVYLRQGANEKALSLLGKAKTDLKDDPRPPFFYAVALQYAGLTDEALVEYERISTGNGPHAGPAALQSAIIMLAKNEVDRAAASLRRAMELNMSSARLFTVQGRIFATQGTLGEAETAYRRALQMESEYAPAHLELGLLQVSRNAVAEGLKELERYLELVGNNPEGLRVNEIKVLVDQLKQSQQAS